MMAKRAPPPAPTPAKASVLWLQGLGSGALLAFATPSFILLGVLLAPALASYAADTEAGKGMTRAVALACLAGALSPAWHLWMAHDRMEVAVALLCDPFTLAIAWGAGASAWALSQVLPAVLKNVWDLREVARAHAIEAELKRLREEWHVD
jgi:hypothetical protein